MVEFTIHMSRLELQVRRRGEYLLPFKVSLGTTACFSDVSIENRRATDVALTATSASLVERLDTTFALDYFGEVDDVDLRVARINRSRSPRRDYKVRSLILPGSPH